MPSSAASFVRLSASGRIRYVSSVMPECLACLNDPRKQKSLDERNALKHRILYKADMATPRFDWYLKEWLATLGKKQADLVRDLDWNKAKVSLTASGKQPYTRDDINEISIYLAIKPYELLMHPEDAMRLRRVVADAIRLAHDAEEVISESKQIDDQPRLSGVA